MSSRTDARCYGLLSLFAATEQECRDQVVLNPSGYEPAIELCKTCTKRQDCAAEGVAQKDRHTVRAGKRLWINSERADLLAISQGDQP